MKKVNRNFPNYSKAIVQKKVISNHPPGPNRAGRRADEAYARGAPTRELKRKAEIRYDLMKRAMREAREKRDEKNRKRSAARREATKKAKQTK